MSILLGFLGALLFSYGLFAAAHGVGAPTPPATWLTHGFMIVITAILYYQGRGVRRLVDGEETSMTPLQAARVAMAAKTAALVGALLTGYFAAVALFLAGLPPAPVRTETLVSAVIGIGVGAVMVGVSVMVEGWCRIDPPDGEDDPGGRDPAAPSAA
ncbi:MAG TPA: DUF3180 domain-containing protein [Actinomycetaceae bacterium]|nr:DUF3180 domain-containing protein [Actinomycetaceae bacterium]